MGIRTHHQFVHGCYTYYCMLVFQWIHTYYRVLEQLDLISFYKSSPPNNKRRNAQASDDKIYKDSDECPCVGSSYVEFLDGKVFNYNATCGQYSLDLNQLCENATRNSDEWWVHMKKIMEQHVTYNCNRSQLFESHKLSRLVYRL